MLKKIVLLSSIVMTQVALCDQAMCHPCIPFASHDLAIAKSRYFYASLDPRDQRVPRVFVQTHAHIASLADWNDEHWVEFGRFVRALEIGLKKTFGADLVNVACLMNLARKEGTHTHWHFIPRLPKPMTIVDSATGEQHTFEDPCYGKPYDMDNKNYRAPSPNMMQIIIQKLQSNVNMSAINDAEHTLCH